MTILKKNNKGAALGDLGLPSMSWMASAVASSWPVCCSLHGKGTCVVETGDVRGTQDDMERENVNLDEYSGVSTLSYRP